MALNKIINAEQAREIATLALRFLAGDPERLGAFLAASGMQPADLRQNIREDGFLAAVLEFMGQDESLLLTFCANERIAPEIIEPSRQALAGPPAQGSI